MWSHIRVFNSSLFSSQKDCIAVQITLGEGLTNHRIKALFPVALPEIFSADLSLLNLPEESLGRSKPATNLMQAH